MNSEPGVELRRIAELLETCEQVSKYDSPQEKEAWTLAHAFLDLEESFTSFLRSQLPRLKAGGMTPKETYELLFDIGEELRHILYHIRDLRFYDYLRDEETE
jgi:hypothetical protein